MDPIRRQYYRFLLVFIATLCIFCIALSFWTIRSAEKVHVSQTYEEIIAIKRVFLKDSVNNVMREIDKIRARNRLRAREDIDRIGKRLSYLWAKYPDNAVTIATEVLTDAVKTERINLLFEDTRTGRILVETAETARAPRFTDTVVFGPYRARFGINEDWVDAEAKTEIADIIHGQKFQNGAYIWVNEVHDWKGGDNYAIRRIHPNLRDTEGNYLSTNTKDIKGNSPYLEELEGVRNHGEIYFRYFFKKLNSEEVAEKLTYSTLYPDFNWIVAMGIYLEDIQTYIDAARKDTARLTIRVLLVAALSITGLFIAAFIILSRMESWFIRKASQNIRIESNTDPLTGALNRRIGSAFLDEAFAHFKRGSESVVLYSFDLDDFKKVNDTWGHDAGDIVLKAVVAEIKKHMRLTDFLFRWGGEEFLLVYSGITSDAIETLAQKLNREIASLPIAIGKSDDTRGERILRITISIGISRFLPTDVSPDEALKRADEALYAAKAAGKNCARIV